MESVYYGVCTELLNKTEVNLILIFAYIQFPSVNNFSLVLHNNFRSNNIVIRQTSEQNL